MQNKTQKIIRTIRHAQAKLAAIGIEYRKDGHLYKPTKTSDGFRVSCLKVYDTDKRKKRKFACYECRQVIASKRGSRKIASLFDNGNAKSAYCPLCNGKVFEIRRNSGFRKVSAK